VNYVDPWGLSTVEMRTVYSYSVLSGMVSPYDGIHYFSGVNHYSTDQSEISTHRSLSIAEEVKDGYNDPSHSTVYDRVSGNYHYLDGNHNITTITPLKEALIETKPLPTVVSYEEVYDQ
jgi:hypothetical protein